VVLRKLDYAIATSGEHGAQIADAIAQGRAIRTTNTDVTVAQSLIDEEPSTAPLIQQLLGGLGLATGTLRVIQSAAHLHALSQARQGIAEMRALRRTFAEHGADAMHAEVQAAADRLRDAPGLRARVVGETFTGFEPLGAAGGTEIPHTQSAKDVVDHLRATPGFGEYLMMLESQGLASQAMVDGVIHHKFNLLGMSGKRVTTEALRGDVRDHFRERVTERLCDPSLIDPASWQRFREMTARLSPTERGNMAEIWYRHRHTKGAKGQARVDVARTSGEDEGKIQRRVVDAVEGDTAIEVKDIVGGIDRDQFGAYMDMLQALDGGDPIFQKVKYVFTKPEGAIANLDYLGGRMEIPDLRGRLTIEVFDYRGNKRTARSLEEAVAIKKLLLGKEPFDE
jgi:hypothetical protein